jgi:type IV secretion system protein VirB4
MTGTDNTRKPIQPLGDDVAALLGRFVPFEALVGEHDVLTRGGDLIRTWRLDALRGDGQMDTSSLPIERQAVFRQLLERLSGGRFALWTHRVRRSHDGGYDVAALPPTAPDRRSPGATLIGQQSPAPVLCDELYLTVLLRSVPRRSPRFLRIPKKASRTACACPAELLGCMQETSLAVSELLAPLRPHLLGEYCIGGRPHNELLDFLGLLVNGSWARQKVASALLYKALPCTQVVFAGEKITFGRGDDAQYAVAFGMADDLRAQPNRAHNLCLPEDCEFIETQSFAPAFERAPEAVQALDRCVQENVDVHEVVLERQQPLGDYHYSLVLFGKDAQQAEHRAAAAAYVIGVTSGAALAVCDMSDAAWFSQWPGTWSWRARQARLSSRVLGATPLYQTPAESG